MNFGRDTEPVWSWQNYNSDKKQWFVRKVDRPQIFDPTDYFKMRRTAEIVGGNKRVVGRLIKEIGLLLELRKEIMAEMVKMKIRMGVLERNIQSRVRKKEPVVEQLKSRVVTRNIVDPEYFRRESHPDNHRLEP